MWLLASGRATSRAATTSARTRYRHRVGSFPHAAELTAGGPAVTERPAGRPHPCAAAGEGVVAAVGHLAW